MHIYFILDIKLYNLYIYIYIYIYIYYFISRVVYPFSTTLINNINN